MCVWVRLGLSPVDDSDMFLFFSLPAGLVGCSSLVEAGRTGVTVFFSFSLLFFSIFSWEEETVGAVIPTWWWLTVGQ